MKKVRLAAEYAVKTTDEVIDKCSCHGITYFRLTGGRERLDRKSMRCRVDVQGEEEESMSELKMSC